MGRGSLAAWAAAGARRLEGSRPVNYRALDASPARISEDAEYALRIARSYVEHFDGGRSFLTGRAVLELGPGTNFATALILKCWGAAKVAVADRFLVRFQADYHVPLYRKVASLLRAEDPAVDLVPLEACISRQEHAGASVACLKCPLEELPGSFRDRFDITLSNAVLEHVFDPLSAAKSLFEVTLPGGMGFHQVDFRDHRDFTRPLEYLLLDEFSFLKMFNEQHGECGNRLRPNQFHAMLEIAGFREVQFLPNMWAEESYLDGFVPRLRDSRVSPYADLNSQWLRGISGMFTITRSPPSNSAISEAGAGGGSQ